MEVKQETRTEQVQLHVLNRKHLSVTMMSQWCHMSLLSCFRFSCPGVCWQDAESQGRTVCPQRTATHTAAGGHTQLISYLRPSWCWSTNWKPHFLHFSSASPPHLFFYISSTSPPHLLHISSSTSPPHLFFYISSTSLLLHLLHISSSVSLLLHLLHISFSTSHTSLRLSFRFRSSCSWRQQLDDGDDVIDDVSRLPDSVGLYRWMFWMLYSLIKSLWLLMFLTVHTEVILTTVRAAGGNNMMRGNYRARLPITFTLTTQKQNVLTC